jgi:hypothetical protein
MYLNALTSNNRTEDELNHSYINSIINISNDVMNNFNYSLTKPIDYFTFIKNKTLVNFDDNLKITMLFKPRTIKKLLTDLSPLEASDIINNITQEVNNYQIQSDDDNGELIEDQW